MTQRQRVKVYILVRGKGRDGHRRVQGQVEVQVPAKGISVLLCGEPEFNIGAKCAFSFLKNKQLETHLCETYNHNYLSGKKVH